MSEVFYEVIEDNAGRLYLFVFGAKGKIEYAMGGYETMPGMLSKDIEELKQSGSTEGWEGQDFWEDKPITPEEFYEQLKDWVDEGKGGAQIIADEKGTYQNKMGVAGKKEFGEEENMGF